MGAAEALGGLQKHCFCNTIGIGQNFIIPETNNPPSLCAQPSCAGFVVSTADMLRSVQFYNQLRRSVGNVDDIGSDHQLPGETRSIRCETMPERPLSIGRAVS